MNSHDGNAEADVEQTSLQTRDGKPATIVEHTSLQVRDLTTDAYESLEMLEDRVDKFSTQECTSEFQDYASYLVGVTRYQP